MAAGYGAGEALASGDMSVGAAALAAAAAIVNEERVVAPRGRDGLAGGPREDHERAVDHVAGTAARRVRAGVIRG